MKKQAINEKGNFSPTMDISFPKSSHTTKECKSKAKWLELMPPALHCKFDEYFKQVNIKK